MKNTITLSLTKLAVKRFRCSETHEELKRAYEGLENLSRMAFMKDKLSLGDWAEYHSNLDLMHDRRSVQIMINELVKPKGVK